MPSRSLDGRIRLFLTAVLLCGLAALLAYSGDMSSHVHAANVASGAGDEEADFANTYCKTNLKTAIPSGAKQKHASTIRTSTRRSASRSRIPCQANPDLRPPL